jgi:hypothetical protein
MRVHRHRNKPFARRSKRCAKTCNLQFAILQEAAAPQLFPLFTHSTIGMAQMLSSVVEVAQMRVARTLSREFWQQKNFHARRLRASSSLAKTGFLSESIAVDSRPHDPAHAMHRRLW